MELIVLETPEEALKMLTRLGAPSRLIRHLELVGEAGEEMTSKLDDLKVQYNKTLVLVGIAVHDAGKILHPEELEAGGSLHEAEGEKLLLQQGVAKEIARCCRSHSQYKNMDVSFEEMLIALADKLWKGKREADLELMIIDEIARRLKSDRWDLFEPLDTCFEEIASNGNQRLSRSF